MLTIAHDLKKAGVGWNHAKAHAKAIADSTEKQYQDLATKDFVTSQIQTVRTEISDLRGDMNTMGSDLRGEMKTMEARILRWAIATAFTVGGGLFAALRLSLG